MQRLQTEGQDIEKLLQQPFKVKHLLTGRALQVKRKAGLFETEALVLQTQTKVCYVVICKISRGD